MHTMSDENDLQCATGYIAGYDEVIGTQNPINQAKSAATSIPISAPPEHPRPSERVAFFCLTSLKNRVFPLVIYQVGSAR